jgi:hypothetical protein
MTLFFMTLTTSIHLTYENYNALNLDIVNNSCKNCGGYPIPKIGNFRNVKGKKNSFQFIHYIVIKEEIISAYILNPQTKDGTFK